MLHWYFISLIIGIPFSLWTRSELFHKVLYWTAINFGLYCIKVFIKFQWMKAMLWADRPMKNVKLKFWLTIWIRTPPLMKIHNFYSSKISIIITKIIKYSQLCCYTWLYEMIKLTLVCDENILYLICIEVWGKHFSERGVVSKSIKKFCEDAVNKIFWICTGRYVYSW